MCLVMLFEHHLPKQASKTVTITVRAEVKDIGLYVYMHILEALIEIIATHSRFQTQQNQAATILMQQQLIIQEDAVMPNIAVQ